MKPFHFLGDIHGYATAKYDTACAGNSLSLATGLKAAKFFVSNMSLLAKGEENYRSEGPRGCVTMWTKRLFDALLEHPSRTSVPELADVLVLDFQTTSESHWPSYRGGERNIVSKENCSVQGHCAMLHAVLQDQRHQRLPVLLFNVHGKPRLSIIRCQEDPQRIMTACFSCVSTDEQFAYGRDLGFPAQPVIRFHVTPSEIAHRCKHAPYLLTFRGGRTCPFRERLAQLHNGRDIIIVVDSNTNGKRAQSDTSRQDPLVAQFTHLTENTQFGVVALGDSPYSYRLLEMLSA